MPFAYYSMDVEYIRDADPTASYLLTLVPVNDADSRFLYGTQPPNILDPMTLSLVNDTYEPGRGPAWWLKTTYNKTVIATEDSFTAANKRRWYSSDSDAEFSAFHMKQKKDKGAQLGDKPWICTWPQTTLELFIYPNQNTSSPYARTATSQTTQTASSTLSIADAAETYNPPFSPPPAYPKVIKMLEHRLSESESSVVTCHQVEIVQGGNGYQPVCDNSNNPIQVVIQENKFDDQVEYNQRVRYVSPARRWGTRSLLDSNSCGCLWWST